MTRPRGKLGRLLRLALLLLCAASALIWTHGMGRIDTFMFTTGRRLWWFTSTNGRLQVITCDGWPCAERARWFTDDPPGLFQSKIPGLFDTAQPIHWRRFGMAHRRGLVTALLTPDGRPASVTEGMWAEHDGSHPLRSSAAMRYMLVDGPIWPLVVLLGAWPLASMARGAVYRVGFWRRVKTGLCPACGYDLRASGGRCPECGTTPETAPV